MANFIERIKMVKAMEFIARQINDEEVFEEWLVNGVADGDIEYANLDINIDDMSLLEYYLDDDSFSNLMKTFLYVIKNANKSGGLYCDKVVSE